MALIAVGVALATGLDRTGASRPLTDGQLHAMEVAALKRLKFPQDFVRRAHNCEASRCYVVAAPPSTIAPLMPGVLQSSGIQPPGVLRGAEPLPALKADHWSIDSRDPFVIACKTTFTAAHTALSACQDAGRVGSTLVNVLVRPYEPCNKQSCAEPGKAEVLAWADALPSSG